MRTRSATALDHRALVGLREVHLLSARAAPEALHLEDLALAIHALLADHGADEDQHDRDAEEDAGEVEGRADDGADDQKHDDGDCDRHEAAQSIRATARTALRLDLAVAPLDVLAGLEVLEVLVARSLGNPPGGRVALGAPVGAPPLVPVPADRARVACRSPLLAPH